MRRLPGSGLLVLLGGGEFSFGETEELDRAWLAKAPEGPIGFLPTASGSVDYGRHFAGYLKEAFGREVETIPVYRHKDAVRGKNAERIAQVAALYIGGGVTDHLLEVLPGTPVGEALTAKITNGGVVVAMSAAAQAAGKVVRSLQTRTLMAGLGWLPDGAVEPNFDPDHDRRLRQLMTAPGVSWGLGLPAESAVLLGPAEPEIVGTAFLLRTAEGDYEVLESNA